MIGAPCGVSPAEFALDLDDAPVEALLVALDGCGTFEQRDRLVGTFIPVHLGEPGEHVSGVAAQGLTPGVDPFAVMPSCEFAPPERGGCTKFIFFFYLYGDHRDLHSFPTRRSSDLHVESTLLRYQAPGEPVQMLVTARDV